MSYLSLSKIRPCVLLLDKKVPTLTLANVEAGPKTGLADIIAETKN
jgi:hypothetical protein